MAGERHNEQHGTEIPPVDATMTYTGVPLRYFLAVLHRASRIGLLDKALSEWSKDVDNYAQILIPTQALDAGRRVFLPLGICSGVTGTAAVFIKNPTVTLNFVNPPTLDVTYNAVEIVDSPPCSLTPTGLSITINLPAPAAPVTVNAAGPAPPLPPPLAPAPLPPAVDVPGAFQCPVPGALAAGALSLIGVSVIVTVSYAVGEFGGFCNTCTAKGPLTATATTVIA